MTSMTAKSTDIEKKIGALEAEESAIESKTSHLGFRDASRRNRIAEQLDVLHANLRRSESHLPNSERPIDEVNVVNEPSAHE